MIRKRIFSIFVSTLFQRWSKYFLLTVLSLSFCLVATISSADVPVSQSPSKPSIQVANRTLEEGQTLYQAGQYTEAAIALEQVVKQAQTDGNTSLQITALRNLGLVYQHLGEWQKANQAIVAGLALITRVDATERAAIEASLLDVQGSLQLDQGQTRDAIATWEKASDLYQQLGDKDKYLRNQINQAQALQQLGFYRRAIDLLTPIVQALDSQPDSITKAVSLRTLGDAQQFAEDLEQARQSVTASLEIAKRLNIPAAISSAELSLGNVLRAQAKNDEALSAYQRAEAASTDSTLKVQAQLNQLSLFIATQQANEAQALWQAVKTTLDTLPVNHQNLFARINLAQSLIQLKVEQNPSPQEIAQILTVAVQQARRLNDQRVEAYAIGTLGTLYETTGQLADAQKLSNQALQIAQTNNANDIAYRWQWQLGRLYKAQGDATANPDDYNQAIAAYSESIKTLQDLRADLVAVNAQAQVSFQESVDPIHREFVSLLLDPKRGEVKTKDLENARNVIESLQLAELDNFFREACLKAVPTVVDQIDQAAAVIYPIILGNRVEVIVSLPQQGLRHYSANVSQDDFEAAVNQLRQYLVIRVGRQYLPGMQKMYDWLIRPAETELTASKVKTLVFVLDGALRNLPMAALHDGKQFLIEKYSVALTPGLQLLDPRPLQERNLSVLTAGLSESRQGFSALPNVVTEIKEIQSTVPARVLLNNDFTEQSFKQALNNQGTPIVHLATHGKFSSKREETYILTWDERLGILTLNDLLQISELNQAGPIELLVLSACETATGDKQAALGMAGMAVRAGARSTIASLWQINDEATALLMNYFYEELAKGKISKAEALRQAQISVLKEPRFRQHPYFWAPYVLIGNWL